MERWCYMGRRFGNNGKMYHLYLRTEPGEGESETIWYPKELAVLPIGAMAEVDVTKKNDKGELVYAVKGKPEWLPKEPRHEKTEQWAADDRLAVSGQEMARLVKKGKKEARDYGSMTLQEAAIWIENQGMPHRRAAALSLIVTYLQSGQRWVEKAGG